MALAAASEIHLPLQISPTSNYFQFLPQTAPILSQTGHNPPATALFVPVLPGRLERLAGDVQLFCVGNSSTTVMNLRKLTETSAVIGPR